MDEVKAVCIKKWGGESSDNRIKYFLDNFSAFSSNFSGKMEECIVALLKEFDYYSQQSVNREFVDLHNRIVEDYKLDLEYTIFAVLESQRGTYNSSYEYISEYKNLNSISKNNIYPNLLRCIESDNWEYVSDVVFIDDFCGSGKTFMDYLLSIKEYIIDKNIYYVVVHTMIEAEIKIKSFADENNLRITIVSNHRKNPAFMLSEELREEKDMFKNRSMELEIKEYEILGYEETEALVAFYENTPNNTLGIFVKDTKKNKALFPRKIDHRPSFMDMKKRRERKKDNNYVCKSKGRNG